MEYTRTELSRATRTMRAIAHPLRERMIDYLIENDELGVSVTNIHEHFDISQTSASLHLGILRQAEIVYVNKVGRFAHYRVNRKYMDNITLFIKLTA